MPIPKPITLALNTQYSDWPDLGHVPTQLSGLLREWYFRALLAEQMETKSGQEKKSTDVC